MKPYKVYQIVLTDKDADEINSTENPRENHPKYKNYTCALFGEFEKVDSQYYSHVATIQAEGLEDVFHIGNMGPEEAIDRHDRMHSISVGDIIVDEDGNEFGVASFGFDELKGMIYLMSDRSL